MIERRQLVNLWQRRNSDQASGGVLITLVRTQGSSYRQTGARLLLLPTGDYAGTISGGCLEAEVTRKATWKTRNGALVETYSTLFDDTAEIPYGLGCGGTVDLLLEPAGTPDCIALMSALQASLRGETFHILTWLPSAFRPLRRAIFHPDGSLLYASTTLVPSQLTLEAPDPDLYREVLTPPQRLIVLGAGDDARPLVRMAALLGWNITVADSRSQLPRPSRFPEAEATLALTPDSISSLRIGSADAIVLMTHSYEQDRDLLTTILPLAPRYLGLLGSRHRSSLLLAEAAARTGLTIAQCCERIFAPIGLDLGGDGPEAIALAVLSEIHAVCTGKLGTSRRLTAEDVSANLARGDASPYLQTRCALDLPA